MDGLKEKKIKDEASTKETTFKRKCSKSCHTPKDSNPVEKESLLQRKELSPSRLAALLPSRIVLDKILQIACTTAKATLSNRLFQGGSYFHLPHRATLSATGILSTPPRNAAMRESDADEKCTTLIVASASAMLYNQRTSKQRRPPEMIN